MCREVVPLSLAPWFMELELQSQDSNSDHPEFSNWATLSCLELWSSGFLSSALSQPQEHRWGRTGAGWLLRGHGEGLSLTRLSSSGLEENSGLSERIWEGEERPGKAVRSASRPPFRLPPLVPCSGAAHLLSKGSNVLIEGIRGADVTARG